MNSTDCTRFLGPKESETARVSYTMLLRSIQLGRNATVHTAMVEVEGVNLDAKFIGPIALVLVQLQQSLDINDAESAAATMSARTALAARLCLQQHPQGIISYGYERVAKVPCQA